MVRATTTNEDALTAADAVRFLQRATFGPTPADVATLQSIGIDAWLDEQFALPASADNHAQLRRDDVPIWSVQWKGMLSGDDQLRRRVCYALSQIVVVSTDGVTWPAVAVFADILERQAFGSYRQLLDEITTSYAMAKYLTFLNSKRADPETGSKPDENYARELMQLFSIGLVELHDDGTPKRRSGATIPTYDQADVAGLAKVFTGYMSDWVPSDPDQQFTLPLLRVESRHSRDDKSFLGVTVPAGTSIDESRKIALDTIADHPNVGPFIGRQLIQRLVTSNPSPAYVRRVATVWADDGAGVRGNLQAVVRAILTDADALDPGGATHGKLREPVLRFTNIARLLGTRAVDTKWDIPPTHSPTNKLAQMPMAAPSVFNFYRPTYVPPHTELGDAGLQSPEFQLVTESTVIGWLNFVATWVRWPSLQLEFETRDELLVQTDHLDDFVSTLDTMLCAGRLEAETATIVLDTLAQITFSDLATQRRERLGAGITLVVASTDYLHET